MGVAYSADLVASGGTAPYRWHVVGAAGPPPGITLTPWGEASGRSDGFRVLSVHRAGDGFLEAVAPQGEGVSVIAGVFAGTAHGPPRELVGIRIRGRSVYSGHRELQRAQSPPITGDTFTSEWVGIDGATNSSLIQAGVTEEYDAATKSILTGAWWEILPAASTPIPMTVNPGDECMVTIYQVSGATWSITLSDVTTGQSFSTEKSYSGPGATEEWIVEAPMNERTGKEDTLGQFSPNVTFSNMRATGTVTAWAKDIMVQDGVRVSVPSTLGTYGFTVAYRSASRV